MSELAPYIVASYGMGAFILAGLLAVSLGRYRAVRRSLALYASSGEQ